ncbi:DUF4364 family protein [Anaeromicropila populeti]|uniref:DUF4364 family protein n=1 Tax=Anaeromicropila populeti TaxID=37658 RepID=A0A1I6JZR3_9FIRM|nr:DUF4364 family protein [Anaeromicropila populeti]SFR84479.1 protein of unknown function [Anaeromicropila populeti]
MQSDSLTLYKLIILYILNKVDFPLTNAQITNFILDREYTNYFTLQQAISEIKDAELIISETIRNSSYFKITDAGRETLHFFEADIAEGIKSDINSYLKENKYHLRQEVSILADYYEDKKNEFLTRCFVREQGSKIVEISLNVSTEEEASKICDNWKKKSQEIYAFLIKTLLLDENQ